MRRIFSTLWNMSYPIALYLIVVTATQLALEVLTGQNPEQIGLYGTILGAIICSPVLLLLFQSKVVHTPPFPRYHKQLTESVSSFLGPVFLGCGACVIGNYLINILVMLLGITSEAFDAAQEALFYPAWYVQIIGIGLLVPIVEELIFRGLIFMKIRKLMPFVMAAFLSALLFGIFHGNIIQGTYAFGIGILFAWTDERYGSLLPSVLMHQAANLTSLLLGSDWFAGFAEKYPILTLWLIPFQILLIVLGVKMTRREGLEL